MKAHLVMRCALLLPELLPELFAHLTTVPSSSQDCAGFKTGLITGVILAEIAIAIKKGQQT